MNAASGWCVSASDWPTVSRLFDEALDLPPPSRQAWLDQLPLEASRHRETLERLLADHDHAEARGFLSVPDRAALQAAARVDLQVGPYRLLEEIGRGGMGSVWLAERSDGVWRGPVALKLPHQGLATRSFADRLARERDILSELNHPHIARLYDAGVSEDGQPFIALAYVAGLTLTEHCAKHSSSVADRVALFRQVVEAVKYAHAHLVVHRDIKPSNVLVDENGQVHLLDFGIAKLIVDGRAEATELTLDAGQALTLDYASPEQIEGHSISTSSDVYSLGVLLYELLAGRRPYQLQRQDPADMARAIRQQSIAPPSAVAADRAAARWLRGDLDTIVLKAIQPDTALRYASADAFGEDLRRQAEGEPVLAQPDSMRYRVGKLVRRHRVAVAASALVVLSVLLGLAGTVWEAAQARQQASRAEAVRDFLIGLFNESDPGRSQGRQLSARDLLERGEQALRKRLVDQPALSAELKGVLASLYTTLGEEKRALPLAQEQVDSARRLYGDNSLEYGDALYTLADAQDGLRDSEAAYQSFEHARSLLQRYPTQRADKLLQIEARTAFELTDMGRPSEGFARFNAVLPRLQSHFGPGSWMVLQHRAHMISAYPAAGEYHKAIEEYRAIEPLLDSVDPSHALDANGIRFMGGHVMLVSWFPDEAVRLLRRTKLDAERLLGPDNSIVVQIERELALAIGYSGHWDEAAGLVQANVLRAQRALGDKHIETRLSMGYGTTALLMTGRTAEASAMARRALDGAAQTDAMTAGRRRAITRRLGAALLFDGRTQEALSTLQSLSDAESAAGSSKSAAHGATLLLLAAAASSMGLPQSADIATQAEAAIEAESNPRDVLWMLPRAQMTHALILARQGKPGPAQELLERARGAVMQANWPDPNLPPILQLVRAELLRSSGGRTQADRLDRSARAELRAEHGVNMPRHLAAVL